MRFVAQWFVKLLERFPFLEVSAFGVIAILGLKLLLSFPTHFYKDAMWAKMIESERADLVVSIITAAAFFLPILTSKFLGFPKQGQKE
jgi:predicted tellurium resistance membrane protein TerC